MAAVSWAWVMPSAIGPTLSPGTMRLSLAAGAPMTGPETVIAINRADRNERMLTRGRAPAGVILLEGRLRLRSEPRFQRLPRPLRGLAPGPWVPRPTGPL